MISVISPTLCVVETLSSLIFAHEPTETWGTTDAAQRARRKSLSETRFRQMRGK